MLTYEFNNQLYIGTKMVTHKGNDYQEFCSADISRPHTLYALLQADGSYIRVEDQNISNALYEKYKDKDLSDCGIVFYSTPDKQPNQYTYEEIKRINQELANSREKYFKEYADDYTEKWGKHFGVNKDNIAEFKRSIIAKLEQEVAAFKFNPMYKNPCYDTTDKTVYFNSIRATNTRETRNHEMDHGYNSFPDEFRMGVCYYSPDFKYSNGVALTEGITAHTTVGASASGYSDELQLTRLLSAVVGEGNLIVGQQRGPGIIQNAYDQIMGENKFAHLMLRMDEKLKAYKAIDWGPKVLPSEIAAQAKAEFDSDAAHKETLNLFFNNFNQAFDKISTYEQAQGMAGIIKNLRRVASNYPDISEDVDKLANQFKETMQKEFGRAPSTHTFSSFVGKAKKQSSTQNSLPSIAQLQMKDLEKEMRWLMQQRKTPENMMRITALTHNYETLKLQENLVNNPPKKNMRIGDGVTVARKNEITGVEVMIHIRNPRRHIKDVSFYHHPYNGSNGQDIAREFNLRQEAEYHQQARTEWGNRVLNAEKQYGTPIPQSELTAFRNITQQTNSRLEKFIAKFRGNQQGQNINRFGERQSAFALLNDIRAQRSGGMPNQHVNPQRAR